VNDDLIVKAAEPYSHEDGPRTNTQYASLPFDKFFAGREPFKDAAVQRAFEVLKELVDIVPAGTIIAGGFMAGIVMDAHLFSDIDLFFKKDSIADEAVTALQRAGYPLTGDAFEALQSTDERRKKLLSFRGKGEGPSWGPQVIKFHEYDDAEHCLDFFDFTATQFAVEVGTQEGLDERIVVVWNPLAPIDYAARRLNFHRRERARVEDRVTKYLAKGFRTTPAVDDCLREGK
jgi:hypothetical protein